MLQFIRDQASGWIAWVIVILICIPFALWGIHQFQGGGQVQSVANVNGTEISTSAFQQSYQNQRQQLQQIFGGQLPALYNESRLRQDTLEQMVNDELIIQAGVNNGMRVGNRQLSESIQTLPLFKSGKGFSTDKYTTFLQSRGLSAAGFETDMRRSILSQQLIAGIQRSAFVTDAEVEQTLKLDNERRRFQSLTIAPAVKDVPEADAAQLKAYFEDHKSRYVVPEQVKIDYIELSRKAIAGQIKVTEQTLKNLYESSRETLGTPEQREVRHILVQVDKNADQAAVEAAHKKIQALAERIAKGEKFADIARTNSDDPGSATMGGSLGYISKGVMDPAFEKAAFSLPEGQISKPVRSSFGWHLIEVTRIQKSHIKSFQEARDQLLKTYRKDQAEQMFAEQIDQLATLAFEQSDSLQPAADALGVPVQHSDYFSRDGVPGDPLLGNAKVRGAAFSPEVMADGNNSEMLELNPETVVVLRTANHRQSHPQDYADVRDQIKIQLRREAALRQAQALGDRILKELENGSSQEQVAGQHNLKWSEPQNLTRRSQGQATPQILEKLFKMPKPTQDGATYAGLAEAGDGYTIIALLGVDSAKPGDEGAVDKKQIEQNLASRIGDQTFSAVVKSLRSRADIKTFMENTSAPANF